MIHAKLHRRLHNSGRNTLHRLGSGGYSVAGSDSLTDGSVSAPLVMTRSAGGVYTYDHEGVQRFARDNEIPFVNARRVENVLARMSVTDSRDLTTAGWTKGANATVTRDSTVLTDDGLPSNKITWAVNDAAADIHSGTVASTVASKRSWIVSVKAKAGTGTTFSIAITDGTDASLAVKTVTLTSAWQIFSTLVTNIAPTSAVVGVRLTRGGANNIYVDWVQFEEVTGASVQVFGGYADALTQYGAGIAGVRNYATTNGNTYNATTALVTEAAGSALTSVRMSVEGTGANLIPAANYRDFSTWTKAGVTMKGTTPAGIDGVTMVTSTNEIMESAALNDHMVYLGFTAATAAKQSAMIAVKRGTGTRHIRLRLNNSVDSNYGLVVYNLDTLALIGSLTGAYSTAYVKGGYTIIELVAANVTTGAQLFIVEMHDGTSATYTGDGVSTLILDWAQVVTSGRPESHVQGATTRNTSFISRSWIGATNNFWMYIDFIYGHSSHALSANVIYIATVHKNPTNYFFIRSSTGGTGILQVGTGNNGVAQTADITSFSIDRGDRCRAVVSYDSSNGLRCRASNNGGAAVTSVVATSKVAITEFSSAATLYLGSFNGVVTSSANAGEYANYKIGTGILTLAQQIELVGL